MNGGNIIKSEDFYKNNILNGENEKIKLSKKINIISILRFVIFIFTVSLFILYFKNRTENMFIYGGILFFIIFAVLIFYHRVLLEKNKKNDLFILINEYGVKRINHEFNKFEDDGSEFIKAEHEFAEDLDIFGHNSLFQYLNTTVTKGGRERLKDILILKDELNAELIYKKQEAIKEMALKKEFRQNLFIEGKFEKTKNIDINEFISWLKKDEEYSKLKIITALVFIMITFISVVLCVKRILPESFILLDLFINFIVMRILNKSMEKELIMLSKVKYHMISFSRILSLIYAEKFNCDYLRSLSDKIKNNNIDASSEMKKLFAILDWIGDSIGNAYYLVLNTIFFLDVFLMSRICKWKNKNKMYVENWLYVINEIDALSSISNIAFDNEDYAYPQINNNETVCGKEIGHPLIGRKGVRNDFSLKDKKKVALITGSNMSGKSTFLRTIGINLVLAYIGAPVCASKFSCSVMKIYTCMRTKDNLEESISSFYAEILRIKQLITACKNKEKVFFLLDEIFKGTNSEDRYTGAKILIKQLIKYGSSGFVSTHDFELCDMENNHTEIVNYNFREYYEENKIKFDYKIRKGRSTTRNAIHLMKLAGIEIE